MDKILYIVFEYLPPKIYKEISKFKNICELRLRVNSQIWVQTQESSFFLKSTIGYDELQNVVLNACKHSVYGYDEYIKRGFITTDFGERIGLCGEMVFNGNEVSTIKNFTSLCIRIPNDIKGCSDVFFKLYKGGSVLVVSRSGVGKTTFIRDLTHNISNCLNKNVVVVDERNEICAKNGKNFFNLGKTVDVLTFSNKNYGFTHALRTLNPSVIVTDELINASDYNGVIRAISGGVDVIATVHGNSVKRSGNVDLQNLINSRVFSYYVLITKNDIARNLVIYDGDLNEICSC